MQNTYFLFNCLAQFRPIKIYEQFGCFHHYIMTWQWVIHFQVSFGSKSHTFWGFKKSKGGQRGPPLSCPANVQFPRTVVWSNNCSNQNVLTALRSFFSDPEFLQFFWIPLDTSKNYFLRHIFPLSSSRFRPSTPCNEVFTVPPRHLDLCPPSPCDTPGWQEPSVQNSTTKSRTSCRIAQRVAKSVSLCFL